MNEDIQKERAKATIEIERLTNLLDGGKEKTERRRQLEAIIERDPVFSNHDNMYLHRTDRHVRAIAKGVRLVEVCRQLGIGKETDGNIIDSPDFRTILNAIADDLPLALHWLMFTPNIVSLCDEKQKEKWLPLCRDFRIIGCYAQTELGHGSNIRALETTATFLPEKDGGMPGGSFVINSPTLSSAKAWPGTLGRVGTHAMVIAQLIDGEGKKRGIHNFLVPIRSTIDLKPLPGVTAIDLGPKLGFNNMDNGLASFDNVMIPRRNMAMGFAEVDEQGKYKTKTLSEAASKIAYITMMQVRAYIIQEASKHLAIACTISIRYSAVRRQGYSGDNVQEVQILDYKQQQHRLLPLLASSYCFFFSGKKVLARLKDMEDRLSRKETMSKEEATDVHATCSALKCVTSTIASNGLEDCRKACGGHGFLQSSGLPELVCTYVHHATVEGDNHMLPQQVLKVLLKMVESLHQGSDGKDYEPCDCGLLSVPVQAILSGDNSICQARAEACGNGKVHTLYGRFLLLLKFDTGIKDEATKTILGSAEIEVLAQLALLCGLYWMECGIGDFLEQGYLTATQARWIRISVRMLLDEVRPNAVGLVDAFDISEFRLKSVLGRYDGNVYPALVEAAKKDPLNQSEPGPGCDQLKRLVVDGRGAYTPTVSRL